MFFMTCEKSKPGLLEGCMARLTTSAIFKLGRKRKCFSSFVRIATELRNIDFYKSNAFSLKVQLKKTNLMKKFLICKECNF